MLCLPLRNFRRRIHEKPPPKPSTFAWGKPQTSHPRFRGRVKESRGFPRNDTSPDHISPFFKQTPEYHSVCSHSCAHHLRLFSSPSQKQQQVRQSPHVRIRLNTRETRRGGHHRMFHEARPLLRAIRICLVPCATSVHRSLHAKCVAPVHAQIV